MYHHRCHTRVKGKPFQTRSTKREKRTTLSILTPQRPGDFWGPYPCYAGWFSPFHWRVQSGSMVFFSRNFGAKTQNLCNPTSNGSLPNPPGRRGDGWDRAAKKKNHPPGNQHPSSMTYRTIDLRDVLKTDGWKMVFWDLFSTFQICDSMLPSGPKAIFFPASSATFV